MKIVVTVLLSVMITAPLAAYSPAVTSMTSAGPGGCHHHPQSFPFSPPTSHKCCQNQHHAAIPQSPFTGSKLSVQGSLLPKAEELIGLDYLYQSLGRVNIRLAPLPPAELRV